jgi:hypothetical protein
MNASSIWCDVLLAGTEDKSLKSECSSNRNNNWILLEWFAHGRKSLKAIISAFDEKWAILLQISSILKMFFRHIFIQTLKRPILLCCLTSRYIVFFHSKLFILFISFWMKFACERFNVNTRACSDLRFNDCFVHVKSIPLFSKRIAQRQLVLSFVLEWERRFCNSVLCQLDRCKEKSIPIHNNSEACFFFRNERKRREESSVFFLPFYHVCDWE